MAILNRHENGGRGLICVDVLKKISNISELLLFGMRFQTGRSRIRNMSVILQARLLAVSWNRPWLMSPRNSILPILFDIHSLNPSVKSPIVFVISECFCATAEALLDFHSNVTQVQTNQFQNWNNSHNFVTFKQAEGKFSKWSQEPDVQLRVKHSSSSSSYLQQPLCRYKDCSTFFPVSSV